MTKLILALADQAAEFPEKRGTWSQFKLWFRPSATAVCGLLAAVALVTAQAPTALAQQWEVMSITNPIALSPGSEGGQWV
ncbi:hypothetical protein [Hymenobacter terrenus]|uniref:hypothetical protein n=1 Tax=Hymenobacter terrenus TaxID=1629124 RepID=UPI00061A05AE|nr:hypothetical protein [Hymenobacter terrenus]